MLGLEGSTSEGNCPTQNCLTFGALLV